MAAGNVDAVLDIAPLITAAPSGQHAALITHAASGQHAALITHAATGTGLDPTSVTDVVLAELDPAPARRTRPRSRQRLANRPEAHFVHVGS